MEKKILVIDDQIESINLIVDILEKANKSYHFYHVLNGLDAVMLARECKPDLILCDWNMPRKSGIETIKQLKEDSTTTHIPVIMVTGVMISSENLQTAFEAGVVDFIKKPIDKIELIARTRSMLMLSEYYNSVIQLKERELVATAVNIIRNNEFNAKLLRDVRAVINSKTVKNQVALKHLMDIQSSLSMKVGAEAWNLFDENFIVAYPDFSRNIVTRFPVLTSSEIRLASLIRLNMGIKEIAAVTFMEIESVKTARSRLRKKMGLDRSENLTNFIMSI